MVIVQERSADEVAPEKKCAGEKDKCRETKGRDKLSDPTNQAAMSKT